MLSFAPAAGAEQAPKSEVTAESVVRDLKYRDVKTAYLLAHSVQVLPSDQTDEVPVEHALLLIEFATNNWRFIHVCLPCGWIDDSTRWGLYRIFDGPLYRDHRDFTQRPTKAEVEQFLEDTGWRFESDDWGYRLLRGEVYADTWQKALGYKPEHQYPKTKP